MFACHKTVEGKDAACAGWLAQVGTAHPQIRLELALGQLEPSRLDPRGEGIEGHESLFDSVQEAAEHDLVLQTRCKHCDEIICRVDKGWAEQDTYDQVCWASEDGSHVPGTTEKRVL